MRNPNGYGSIDKLTDCKRRKPWRVRITAGWEWDSEKEVAKQVQRPLGYFKTRAEAVKHLAVYNADPYDMDAQKITFAEVYKIVWDETISKKGKAMQTSMKAAYGHCNYVHNVAMGKIKASDWKQVFSALEGKSKSTVNNVKILAGWVYDYCNDEAEMKLRNYTKRIEVDVADPKAKGSFTVDQLQVIWDNLDKALPKPKRKSRYNMWIPFNDTLIIMAYTGMRISELLGVESRQVLRDEEDRYYIDLHGSKTDAARRVIPIHDKIVPLIEKRLQEGNIYLISDGDGEPIRYETYNRLFFTPMMKEFGITKKIHECRHTFATFAKRSKMDELARKIIVGHAITDFTDRTYTHYDLKDLRKEMDKLKIL